MVNVLKTFALLNFQDIPDGFCKMPDSITERCSE